MTTKSADDDRAEKQGGDRSDQGGVQPGSGPDTGTAAWAGQTAVEQFATMVDRRVEQITSVKQQDQGWTVDIEVVETARTPSTTDILALYEVEIDADGDVTGYRRMARFVRGRPDE